MSWKIAVEAMWLVPKLRFGRQPPGPRPAADAQVEAGIGR
jgi:hypothetical protein